MPRSEPSMVNGHQRASTVVERLMQLRFLVGALGERLGWWPGHFTDEIGLRRLATLFPRTYQRASLESVTIAARRDHDPRLNPASVHLFRLGNDQEDTIAHHLAQGTALSTPPSSVDEILAKLDELGPPDGAAPPVGPCSLGKSQRTRRKAVIEDLARVYAASARSDRRAIPYFEAGG